MDRAPPRIPIQETDFSVTRGAVLRGLFGRDEALRIGRYRVERRIGAGAMGRVYVATDPELQRKVAIKLIDEVAGSVAASRQLRERQLQEANALARVSHPNVVTVYEAGVVGDEVYVVTEFIDGADLGVWLAQSPRSFDEVLVGLIGVGRGLAAVHRAGLVHRDVKPANILVAETGRGVLADFGLARLGPARTGAGDGARGHAGASRGLASATRLAGTPAYLAPELAMGAKANPSTDQFSFGVTLCEAVCGERPIITHGAQVSLPRSSSSLRPTVRRVIARAVAVAPGDRFRDVDALVDALESSLRPRPAWRWIAGFGLLGVGAVGSTLVRPTSADASACETAPQQMAALWNDDARRAVHRALAETELAYAAQVAPRVRTRLDDYASAWVDTYVAVCRGAADVAPTHRDAQLHCLNRRRAALTTAVEVLRRGGEDTVRRAIPILDNLASIDSCTRVSGADASPPASIAVEVRHVEEELARVHVLLDAAQNEQARSAADDLGRRSLELGYPPLIAQAAFVSGLSHSALGDYAAAESALTEAYFAATAADLDTVAADAATELVYTVGYRRARHESAWAWYEHATAALGRLGDPPDRLSQLLAMAGTTASVEGRFDEALDYQRQTLALRERIGGLELAYTLNNLAVNLSALGEYAEAETRLRSALGIRQRLLGDGHPLVGTCWNNLGTVAHRAGRKQDAAEAFGRALEIWEASLGGEHPDFVGALNNYGDTLTDLDRPQEAVAALERARDLWIAALGPDNPDVALALNNLGRAWGAQDRYERAIRYYEAALRIQLAAVGSAHVDVGITEHNLGDALLEVGRTDEARGHIERSLEVFEAALGAEHPVVAYPLTAMGSLHVASGDARQAVVLLERALRLRINNPGPDEERARSEFALARALWAMNGPGDRERARSLANFAVNRYARVGGTAGAAGVAALEWLVSKGEPAG